MAKQYILNIIGEGEVVFSYERNPYGTHNFIAFRRDASSATRKGGTLLPPEWEEGWVARGNLAVMGLLREAILAGKCPAYKTAADLLAAVEKSLAENNARDNYGAEFIPHRRSHRRLQWWREGHPRNGCGRRPRRCVTWAGRPGHFGENFPNHQFRNFTDWYKSSR